MKRGITILGIPVLAATTFLWLTAGTALLKAQNFPAADRERINDLVLANRILASSELGITDAWGHVSVRSSVNPNHYYISRYVSPGLVTVSDIIENDLDSVAVNGPRKDEYQERFIHGEIYKARPDVMAVLHAHTPELVVFGVSSVPLFTLGSPLPKFDLRPVNAGKPGIVTTAELGRALAKTLGKSPAALMLGHGVAVVDTSVPALVMRVNQMRHDAQVEMNTIALGGKFAKGVYTGEVPSDSARNGDWETWKAMITHRMATEPQSAARKSASLAEDMIWANKMLASADLGVLDATGEVSVRNPANLSHFFVIRNVAPGHATASDIIEDDLDCKAVGSNSEQRPEIYIHCAIYAARPDVMAIAHAHTPEVEAFSKSTIAVRPVANLATFMGDGLTKFDIRGTGIPDVAIDSMAKGKKVAEALGTRPGLVLTNHGFVVVDSSVYTLVSRADDMKLNARMQLQAILLGGKITYVVPLLGAAGSAPAPTVPLPKAVGGNGGGTSLDRAWEYWRYLLAAAM